jgi:hypothetical protein
VNRAAAVRTRLIHPLEPESRPPTAWIHEVLGRTVAARLIPERGAPERHHLGRRDRVRNDEQALNGQGVGRQAQPCGGRGDPAGHLDVALAHPVVLVGVRDQAHGHTVVPQVNVGLVVLHARQLADRLHGPYAGRERPSPEVRGRAIADDPPVVDASRFVELLSD